MTIRVTEANMQIFPRSVSKKAEGHTVASAWLSMALALLMLFPALSAYGQFESASVLGYAKDASDRKSVV